MCSKRFQVFLIVIQGLLSLSLAAEMGGKYCWLRIQITGVLRRVSMCLLSKTVKCPSFSTLAPVRHDLFLRYGSHRINCLNICVCWCLKPRNFSSRMLIPVLCATLLCEFVMRFVFLFYMQLFFVRL